MLSGEKGEERVWGFRVCVLSSPLITIAIHRANFGSFFDHYVVAEIVAVPFPGATLDQMKRKTDTGSRAQGLLK
jgi:hypothetical protein